MFSPECLKSLNPYIIDSFSTILSSNPPIRLILALLVDLRYDKIKKRVISNGYFLWLTIGYGIGKCPRITNSVNINGLTWLIQLSE